MVALAAASALAQYMQSERARKASAEERRAMMDMYRKLQTPDIDSSDFTPEEYEFLGGLTPELSQLVQEVAPTTIKTSPAMAAGQQSQIEAMNRFREISRAERDPALMAMLEESSAKAAATAQQQREATLAAMQRRGQMGSGMELSANLEGQGQAMARQASEGRAAAIEAYRNRMNAMGQQANIGGRVFDQDMGMQRTNADIINSFNQRSATNAQNYYDNRANAINQHNVQRQNVHNMNIGAKNQFKMNKVNNQRNTFNDELSKVRGMAGIQSDKINDIRMDAADRNQAIQGVTNAAGSYYSGQQSQANFDKGQDNQNRRVVFEKTGQWMTPEEYSEYQRKKNEVNQPNGYGSGYYGSEPSEGVYR